MYIALFPIKKCYLELQDLGRRNSGINFEWKLGIQVVDAGKCKVTRMRYDALMPNAAPDSHSHAYV